MPIPPVVIPVRVEKDGPIAAIRETEAVHQASVNRMASGVRAIGPAWQDAAKGSSVAKAGVKELADHGERAGANFRELASIAKHSGHALVQAMSAATAGAAGAEHSFVALGSSILTSFAAGGPIAGGIAVVAGGIGWLVGNAEKAEEAAKKAAEAWTTWLDSVKEGAKRAADSLEDMKTKAEAAQFKLSGGGPDEEQIAGIKQRRALYEQIQALKAVIEEKQSIDAAALVRRSGLDWSKAGATIAQRFKGRQLSDAEGKPFDISGAVRFRPGTDQLEVDTRKEVEVLGILEKKLHDLEEAAKQYKAAKDAAATGEEQQKAEQEANAAERETKAVRDSIEVLRQRTDLEKDITRARQERDAAIAGGAPKELAQQQFLLKVEEARRAEAKRYAGDIAKQRADEEAFWKAIDELIEEDRQKQEKLDESSAGYLRHLDETLAVEKASEGVERDRVEAENQVAEAILAGTLAAKDQAEALKKLLEIAAQRRANAATKEADAKQKRDAEEAKRKAEQEAKARAEATTEVERQVKYLEAANEQERAILEIEDKIADLRAKGVNEDLLARYKADLVKQVLAKDAQDSPIQTWLKSIEPTLSGGLADLIADGIETGFKNAGDIAHQLWTTLLHQLLNDLITSGLQAAIAGLAGGLGGGGGGGGGSIIGTLVGAVTGVATGGGGGGAAVATGATGGTGSC